MLDPAVVVGPIDGVTIGIDTVISEPDGWLLYMTAHPYWWVSREPGTEQYAADVRATDDQGGIYTEQSDGSCSMPSGGETACLSFHPRLDPAATALRLVLRGLTQEVALTVNVSGEPQR